MTTVWRTKAYDMFGFKPGAYSYAKGKVELFADLFIMATRAAAADDEALLDRIFEYVQWADRQNAENLKSAVDIAFFLPMLADEHLLSHARRRISSTALTEKRILLSDP
jgi:hypothetical protein